MKTRRWLVDAATVAGSALLVALAFVLLRRDDPPPVPPPGSVASVDVDLAAIPERQSAFATTSVDGPRVEALAAVARAGKAAEDHKCSDSGSLTFHQKDGSVVVLNLLAGHDRRYYEFRTTGVQDGIYRVDRAPLQQALSALGAGPLDPGLPNPK